MWCRGRSVPAPMYRLDDRPSIWKREYEGEITVSNLTLRMNQKNNRTREKERFSHFFLSAIFFSNDREHRNIPYPHIFFVHSLHITACLHESTTTIFVSSIQMTHDAPVNSSRSKFTRPLTLHNGHTTGTISGVAAVSTQQSMTFRLPQREHSCAAVV